MNKALLIIDIQNDYFANGANPLSGAENASLKAKKILELFRKNSLEVIHIQHVAVRADATFFLPGTEGCCIHNNVAPLETEKVIVKHFPNSFRDTMLLDHLKEKGISELVICGMMTHMCIDASIRAAKDIGFNCTLIGDACATKNLLYNGHEVQADDVHYGFLAALNYFYATVKTADQYLMEA